MAYPLPARPNLGSVYLSTSIRHRIGAREPPGCRRCSHRPAVQFTCDTATWSVKPRLNVDFDRPTGDQRPTNVDGRAEGPCPCTEVRNYDARATAIAHIPGDRQALLEIGTRLHRTVVAGAVQLTNGAKTPAGAQRRCGRASQGGVTIAKTEGNQLPYQGNSARNRRGSGVRTAMTNSGAKRL
jgi:hypothetical protein